MRMFPMGGGGDLQGKGAISGNRCPLSFPAVLGSRALVGRPTLSYLISPKLLAAQSK